MNKSSNKSWCEQIARDHDLTVIGYNPGDGVKVRVFEGPGKNWHDSHAIFATNQRPGAWVKALQFLEGYAAGYAAGHEQSPNHRGQP